MSLKKSVDQVAAFGKDPESCYVVWVRREDSPYMITIITRSAFSIVRVNKLVSFAISKQ